MVGGRPPAPYDPHHTRRGDARVGSRSSIDHLRVGVNRAALSREELEKLPRHMRPQGGQSGGTGTRRDTTLRVTLDGRPILEKTYRPSGLRHDGPTFVYEELSVPLGRHVIEAALVEALGAPAKGVATSSPDRRIVAEAEIESGQVLLLELSTQQELTLRWGGQMRATGDR
jgi:hypothetical protein